MGSTNRAWTRSNVVSSFVSMGTKKITGRNLMAQARHTKGLSSLRLHQFLGSGNRIRVVP
jgi:hypothetical protein